jgi:hypothetical protein
MNTLAGASAIVLTIALVIGSIGVLVLKALAVDEVKGRMQRRIRANVEATIATLPEELKAEYAEEWRAELDAIITMPLTASSFARGLRSSARELTATPALQPVEATVGAVRRGARPRRTQTARTLAQLRDRIARRIVGRATDGRSESLPRGSDAFQRQIARDRHAHAVTLLTIAWVRFFARFVPLVAGIVATVTALTSASVPVVVVLSVIGASAAVVTVWSSYNKPR